MSRDTRTTSDGQGRLGRLFGRGAKPEPRPGGVLVGAPVGGVVLPLEALDDGVFSAGILGAGLAIRPEAGAVTAPIDGEVVSVMPHAYGIRSDEGVDVLVHVGIDTVELRGAHFAPQVRQQQRIRRGDLLVQVDLEAISDAGYRTDVVVLVTNAAECTAVEPSAASVVTAGQALITVTR